MKLKFLMKGKDLLHVNVLVVLFPTSTAKIYDYKE